MKLLEQVAVFCQDQHDGIVALGGEVEVCQVGHPGDAVAQGGLAAGVGLAIQTDSGKQGLEFLPRCGLISVRLTFVTKDGFLEPSGANSIILSLKKSEGKKTFVR